MYRINHKDNYCRQRSTLFVHISMNKTINTVNNLIYCILCAISTKNNKMQSFINLQFYYINVLAFTLQMQSLIRECISADPSSRPDIHYVYGVAQDMHSRRMFKHPVALHPPSTVSIRGVPLHSTLAYTSSSVELSVQETRELP